MMEALAVTAKSKGVVSTTVMTVGVACSAMWSNRGVNTTTMTISAVVARRENGNDGGWCREHDNNEVVRRW